MRFKSNAEIEPRFRSGQDRIHWEIWEYLFTPRFLKLVRYYYNEHHGIDPPPEYDDETLLRIWFPSIWSWHGKDFREIEDHLNSRLAKLPCWYRLELNPVLLAEGLYADVWRPLPRQWGRNCQ